MAFDAADASSEDGVEQAVVAGFADELADGAELEVDGGGAEAVADEFGAVGVDGRFAKGAVAFGLEPSEEVAEGFVIGTAAVGAGEAVGDGLDEEVGLGGGAKDWRGGELGNGRLLGG